MLIQRDVVIEILYIDSLGNIFGNLNLMEKLNFSAKLLELGLAYTISAINNENYNYNYNFKKSEEIAKS